MTETPSTRTEVRENVAENKSNVFSEFASSLWRSGVQKPVESLGQVVGVNTSNVATDDHLTGCMKIANMAGNAAGQLLDLAVLNVGIGKAFGAAKGLGVGFESMTAQSLAVNGTAGLIYGGLLRPVEPGESQWR